MTKPATSMDHSFTGPIFVLGYPGYLGGADTELWHTIKLWRSMQLDVRVIPTWQASPEWKSRLESIGVPTIEVSGQQGLASVPDLAGSPILGMCNAEFLTCAATLKQMSCQLIWVNCMTWLFPKELQHYEHHGPFDAYVFQSNFQRNELYPRLQGFDVTADQCHLIRGAFAFDEFPYSPLSHSRGEPFIFGRVARPDLDKWSSNVWPIYSAVQYTNKLAKVMAWDDRLSQKCGPPPSWALALRANAEPVRKFLSSLHCMLPINGGARENWPRSGLEAMATGVPIVAQNQWGWREMIEHGVSGFLGDDDCELAHYTAVLAHDEELRVTIAGEAHRRLLSLASPDTLCQNWLILFSRISPHVHVQCGAETNNV